MNIKDYLLEYYIGQNGEVITEDLAQCIVKGMAVTDGSSRPTGEKWNIDEAQSLGDKLNIDWQQIPRAEFYLVLNMLYSDYGAVLKKYGHTEPTIYAELTRAWFDDVDAKENKTFSYFL